MSFTHPIVILGGGESGTGAAVLAHALGAPVFLSDGGTLSERYRTELTQYGIPFEEGGHTEVRVLEAELVVKSPGIPEKAPIVQLLRKAGKRIISEIEFAYQALVERVEREGTDMPVIIAVTGSNGKTTTTSLVYHMLHAHGQDVCLGGNIGISFARAVATEPLHAYYVLEISSFQLDDVETFTPTVAVLTNITPDHLDRYDYQMDNYAAAKLRIAAHLQGIARENFIWNANDQETLARLTVETKEGRQPRHLIGGSSFGLRQTRAGMHAWLRGGIIQIARGNRRTVIAEIEYAKTHLLGKHNALNIMAACLAISKVWTTDTAIYEHVYTFQPIVHRLEPVGIINGVRYINDSKATNVDSVVYALSGVPGSLVWIAGGVDKGNDYTPLIPLANGKVKALIVLGDGGESLRSAFAGVIPVIRQTHSMAEAVQEAAALALEGDAVLLSPACASFDLFKNYEDRGAQFRQCVQALTAASAANQDLSPAFTQ